MRIHFLLIFLIFYVTCAAQGFRATFKVLDVSTNQAISNANVEVEQLPGVINSTDDQGIVIYRSIPEGRISVRVSAKGYLPKVEHYTNISSEEKNNYYVIKLTKTAVENEVLFFGEIINENDEDVSGATVEIKILNRTFTSETDLSGNFSINVPERYLNGAANFKIEVANGCPDKYREERIIPNVRNIQVDLVLNCGKNPNDNSSRNSGLDKPVEWRNSNVSIRVSGCTQKGTDIVCNFKVEALHSEMGYTIDLPGTEIYVAPDLFQYQVNYVGIAENSTTSGWVGKQIFPGYEIDVVLKFGKAYREIDKIVSLKIRGWDTIIGNYYGAEFSNIPVN